MAEAIENQEERPEGEPEPSPFEGPENPQEPEPEEADAEEGDGEPVGDLEGPVAPEPQGMSEKELERSLKALERGATGWRNKVETIMGAEAAMLIPCPLCEPIIPGFVMQVDEARKSAVRAFLGDREPDNYQPDPHSRRCEACDGHGEVLTGSRVQAQLVASCVECNGRGWIGDRVKAGTPPAFSLAPVPPTNGPPAQGFTPELLAKAQELREAGMVVITPAPPPLVAPS